MDQAKTRGLIELLDQLVWEEPADRLRRQEQAMSGRLAGAGLSWGQALRELSDESLALAIQKDFRRKEAFEELLVHRYLGHLARWFYRWGVDADRAQDLVQQILCRFLRNRLASFVPSASFRAYLWQGAHNLWVDTRRRQRESVGLNGVPDPPDVSATAEEALLAREMAGRVEEALGHLCEVERAVLRGAINGQDADETAAALGLPKPRVFAVLFRARRKMERLLGLPSQTRPYRGDHTPEQ
jgi:RNA polymerase sigma factor (sigma-70 family)